LTDSPIAHDRGARPRRIVIRDLGDEYVIHTQILSSEGRASFVCGHYFREECQPIR
jgi:hypothetical protein